jgi:hypothetical protein
VAAAPDDPSHDAVVRALCAVIQAALPEADESVKWNAPSFSVADLDLVTLSIAPRHGVRVVFHRGATAFDTRTGNRLIADLSGRLTWATDQRAHVAFSDPAAVQDDAAWLGDICRRWAAAAGR